MMLQCDAELPATGTRLSFFFDM